MRPAKNLQTLVSIARQRCLHGEASLEAMQRRRDEAVGRVARLRDYAQDYRRAAQSGDALRDAAQWQRRQQMIAQIDEQADKLEHVVASHERNLAVAHDAHRIEQAREVVLRSLLARSVQAESELDMRRQLVELDSACALTAQVTKRVGEP